MKTFIVKAGIVILIAFFSMQFHTILGSYNRSQVLLDTTAGHILNLPPVVQGIETRLR